MSHEEGDNNQEIEKVLRRGRKKAETLPFGGAGRVIDPTSLFQPRQGRAGCSHAWSEAEPVVKSETELSPRRGDGPRIQIVPHGDTHPSSPALCFRMCLPCKPAVFPAKTDNQPSPKRVIARSRSATSQIFREKPPIGVCSGR